MKHILFVCVHNAGRSQMAEAICNHFARLYDLSVAAKSAGTLGAGNLNPFAVQAVEELGIAMSCQFPKQLTQELVADADRIVSMGCGVDAEVCPAKFIVTEDWGLDDPAGRPIEDVRVIRDQIVEKVKALLREFE